MTVRVLFQLIEYLSSDSDEELTQKAPVLKNISLTDPETKRLLAHSVDPSSLEWVLQDRKLWYKLARRDDHEDTEFLLLGTVAVEGSNLKPIGGW